jgi:FAD synthetase
MKSTPIIAIFGSFDGLHPGHEHLLREAEAKGDVLVILAQDSVIRRLKHREPHRSFKKRAEVLQKHPAVSRVIPSDNEEGEYRCIWEEKPDIVGFGYDQRALQENFLAWKEKTGYHCSVVTFSPFEPEKYKTSLLYHSV